MDVVFSVNPLGLEGLGATLSSLIRNCNRSEELQFWFFCSEFGDKDKANINQLLEIEGFKGTVKYVDFDAKAIFGHLRSLHGDWTTYGRLLIPDYVQNDTALYLDSDLIILTDVLTLKEFDFDGAALAAVYGSPVSSALEKNFFIDKLKCAPDQAYFNAGILLLNLKKWREENVEAKWKRLAEKYPNELLSVDQTLLNAVCEGNFARLLPVYNNPWYPGSEKPVDADHSIIHFVGSPKPWDFFAKNLHKGNKVWEPFNNAAWKKEYGGITVDKIKRTWKIRRSLLKLLKAKII
ncbi:MAG: glycosyltransferase family 8 protein [Ferruginibacter sp.]